MDAIQAYETRSSKFSALYLLFFSLFVSLTNPLQTQSRMGCTFFRSICIHTKSLFLSRFRLFLDSCRFQLLNFVCDITTNPENQFVSKCQMPCTHIIYTCELYSQLYGAITFTFCVVGVVHFSTDIPYTHVYVITALFFKMKKKEDPISCQGSLLRLFRSVQNSI